MIQIESYIKINGKRSETQIVKSTVKNKDELESLRERMQNEFNCQIAFTYKEK